MITIKEDINSKIWHIRAWVENKIKEVIIWCQQDDFWYKNILSTEKLRKQYDRLVMNMVKPKNKKEDNGLQYKTV